MLSKYIHNMTPRCSLVIATQILGIIPETETEFRNRLDKFIRSNSYKPPELTTSCICWNPLADTIQEFISFDIMQNFVDKNTWQAKVLRIFFKRSQDCDSKK